jgi:hypothetical protein
MLGIRRTGVSAASSALKKRSIINYKRGMIEILNRQELNPPRANATKRSSRNSSGYSKFFFAGKGEGARAHTAR